MAHHIVTGGAGFIGSHLVRGLLAAGHSVRVIDNFSTGRRENLAGLAERHPASLVVTEGTVTDVDFLRQHFTGADTVFHQAALPSVPKSVEDPLRCNFHNIDGTLAVLVAARDCGVRRVVYAASSSAYGDTPTLPKVETMPAQPLSPYALSKFAGEEYARIFHLIYGLETISLRYFNIFGPRQDPASQYAAVIPKFIDRLLRGEPPVIYGDGRQSRDFTYVDNVVRANLQASAAPSAACGQVYNIACGLRIDLNELVGMLNDILGTRLAPRYDPPRPGDILHSLADIRLAREKLGYAPEVDVAEGLRRTVEWFRPSPPPDGSRRPTLQT
jgi:UDP-glucose 4-epimerase